MKNLVRLGMALGAMVGFSALVGTQAVGASQAKSYLGVYEALNQAVTEFSVGFTVPHYTCTATNDNLAAYANTFDQDNGSQGAFNGGFVQLGCTSKKKPALTPVLEIDGNYTVASDLTVHRGDVIDVTATCGASGSEATIDDVTEGNVSQSATSFTASSCNGTFMGNIGVSNEAGTKELPLPSFHSITFGDAQVNGSPLGDASPAPAAVNYFEGKKNVITVGPLTDGGSSWVNTQGS
jgi:hypothetical protein